MRLDAARPAMLSSAVSRLPRDFVSTPDSNLGKILGSYIDAMLAGAGETLRSFRVVAAPVSGGVAAPGGPVVGALLTVSPGSALFKPSDAEGLFNPPSFSLTMPDGETRTGSYTPWLRAFTKVLLQSTDTALNTWLSSWSVAGASVVVGGSAAWVPSAPPAPGPWVGGTVTPFPLIGGAAQAPSPAPRLAADTSVSRGKSTSVSIDVGGSEIETMLVVGNGQGENFLRALSAAFLELTVFIGRLTVVDKSGAGGSGVAAPGGVITGTIAELTLDVQ